MPVLGWVGLAIGWVVVFGLAWKQALKLAANLTSVEAHEEYLKEAQEEVAAQVGLIDMVRRRLTLLRRQSVTA